MTVKKKLVPTFLKNKQKISDERESDRVKVK